MVPVITRVVIHEGAASAWRVRARSHDGRRVVARRIGGAILTGVDGRR